MGPLIMDVKGSDGSAMGYDLDRLAVAVRAAFRPPVDGERLLRELTESVDSLGRAQEERDRRLAAKRAAGEQAWQRAWEERLAGDASSPAPIPIAAAAAWRSMIGPIF